MKKIQVLLVHGGMTFKSDKDYITWLKARDFSLEKWESWNGEYLTKNLGKNFQTIRPRMPLQDNAKYRDWKIWFERYLKLLGNDFILIGSSLGGIFLAQYLSENKLLKKALAVYLVCPPFDNEKGGFKLKKDLSLLEQNTKNLHLLFSADDPVVPASHAEKFRQALPNAHIVIYKSKGGHFFVPKFPEIIKMIKADVKGK